MGELLAIYDSQWLECYSQFIVSVPNFPGGGAILITMQQLHIALSQWYQMKGAHKGIMGKLMIRYDSYWLERYS